MLEGRGKIPREASAAGIVLAHVYAVAVSAPETVLLGDLGRVHLDAKSPGRIPKQAVTVPQQAVRFGMDVEGPLDLLGRVFQVLIGKVQTVLIRPDLVIRLIGSVGDGGIEEGASPHDPGGVEGISLVIRPQRDAA